MNYAEIGKYSRMRRKTEVCNHSKLVPCHSLQMCFPHRMFAFILYLVCLLRICVLVCTVTEVHVFVYAIWKPNNYLSVYQTDHNNIRNHQNGMSMFPNFWFVQKSKYKLNCWCNKYVASFLWICVLSEFRDDVNCAKTVHIDCRVVMLLCLKAFYCYHRCKIFFVNVIKYYMFMEWDSLHFVFCHTYETLQR